MNEPAHTPGSDGAFLRHWIPAVRRGSRLALAGAELGSDLLSSLNLGLAAVCGLGQLRAQTFGVAFRTFDSGNLMGILNYCDDDIGKRTSSYTVIRWRLCTRCD